MESEKLPSICKEIVLVSIAHLGQVQYVLAMKAHGGPAKAAKGQACARKKMPCDSTDSGRSSPIQVLQSDWSDDCSLQGAEAVQPCSDGDAGHTGLPQG